jgi:hypothetical protein
MPLLLAAALAYASSEVGRRLERPPDVPFNVGAHGREVPGRPVHHHEMETIVGRRATESMVVTHVQLDIVLSDATEVRVVAAGRHWTNVVLRRSHRACDE